MKKFLILTYLFVLLFLNSNAKFIKIYREKVGGNQTNKFYTVDRTTLEGPDVITIYINCTNPGENDCPTAKPRTPSDPATVNELNLAPSIVNAIENIYTDIDVEFENENNSGEDSKVISIVDGSGNQIFYTINYKWYLTNGNVQKSEITISDPY